MSAHEFANAARSRSEILEAEHVERIVLDNGYPGSIYIPELLRRDLVLVLGRDNQTLFRRCIEIARRGDDDAFAIAALLHYNGATRVVDRLQTAVDWSSAAAASGRPFALYVYGVALLESQEHERAFEKLRSSADSGFGPAAWLTAKMYEEGIGVKSDLVQSETYFKISKRERYLFGPLSLIDLNRRPEMPASKRMRAIIQRPIAEVIFRFRNTFGGLRFRSRYLFPENMARYLANLIKRGR